jgi:hypothetical protein
VNKNDFVHCNTPEPVLYEGHGEARADAEEIEGETLMTNTGNTVTQVSTTIAALVLGLYGVLFLVHSAGLI